MKALVLLTGFQALICVTCASGEGSLTNKRGCVCVVCVSLFVYY